MSTKGREENLCRIIIWFIQVGPGRTLFLIHEGARGTPFVVGADHGRRSRESLEKRSDSGRRRPAFGHIVSSLLQMSTEPGKHPGQTHLNSDAKIADYGRAHGGGGHPRGVPLRVDDGGAHTGGEGTHEGCPYGWIIWARTRGEGTHKGCPYGWIIWARIRGGGHPRGVPLRVDNLGAYTGGGHPQGVPLRVDNLGAYTGGGHPRGVPLRVDDLGAYTGGRAPTRGAPTGG